MSALAKENAAAAVAVVACIGEAAQYSRVRALIERDGAFEIVATAVDDLDLIGLCRIHRPGLVVVDERAGSDVQRTARRLATERPLPVVMLVDDPEGDIPEALTSLRISTVPRARFDASNPAECEQLLGQLRALAHRAGEPRTTLSKASLQSVVVDIFEESPASGVHPELVKLARTPRDLLCVVAVGKSSGMLSTILEGVKSARVPVLVITDMPLLNLETTARASSIPFRRLSERVLLRRAEGLLLAGTEALTTLEEESIRPWPGRASSVTETINSVAAMGERALTVVTDGLGTQFDPEAKRALARMGRSGRALRVVGGTSVLGDRWQASPPTILVGEMTWLWNHLCPRCV